MEKQLFNIILVHTARTWERIRLEQPHQEMSQDNIESVDSILSISDEILKDKVIQEFLTTEDKADFFIRKTDLMSDSYIEALATKIIKEDYL